MTKVKVELFMMCDCVDSTSLIEVTDEELGAMKDFRNEDGDYIIGGIVQNFGLVGKRGEIITFYDGDLSWQENFKRGDR